MRIRSDESIQQFAERIALWLALPAGVMYALFVIAANFTRNPIPLVGDPKSYGSLFLFWLLPASLLTCAIAYVFGSWAWNARVKSSRQRSWVWGIVPIALAYLLLLLSITIIALQVIEGGFRQLTLNTYQGAILGGAAGAALIYWMIKQVISLTANKLLQLIAIILGGGVYLAAAQIEDPLWWHESFSHLGTVESNASIIFNATLIFAGILLMVMQPYLASDLEILVRHNQTTVSKTKWLWWLFLLLSVAIAAVGVIRYGITPISSFLHNTAAYVVAAVFVILMLFIRWFIPGLTREVFTTSWILVAILGASMVIALFGYFNTVGLELISFVLGIAWLQFFTRNVFVTAAELEASAFPE